MSEVSLQPGVVTDANPLHLLFHGGSGSEKARIAEAVSYGVFKMNIDTDTQFAFLRLGEQGIVERLQKACEDLGSSGKSIARS